jgi:2-(1,2-epoxy-1,2-dihydrophenyl)acetyl-CoA isomerase
MKRLVDRAFQSSLAQMLEDEQTAQVLLTGSVDHREGVTAFGEKRQAKFQGR